MPNNKTNTITEIELEDDTSEINDQSEIDLSNYPDMELNVVRDQYSIFQLMRKISQGALIIDPDFQREFVWDIE